MILNLNMPQWTFVAESFAVIGSLCCLTVEDSH